MIQKTGGGVPSVHKCVLPPHLVTPSSYFFLLLPAAFIRLFVFARLPGRASGYLPLGSRARSQMLLEPRDGPRNRALLEKLVI